MLELSFFQVYCISIGQTKVAQRSKGDVIKALEGGKNREK